MSWNKRALGKLLDQSGYDRAKENDYPILSITMKHGLIDQSEKFKKRVASNDTSKYRVVYRNELVVGFPIDEGVLGFQTKYPAGVVSPAYDIWKLKEPSETCIPYLERYLRSSHARHLYASKMQGAVARRRSLKKSDFLKLEIPFPLLDNQIRIAHLLSKVEGLIVQRKQNLQQLDELLKSVFLEMFGDPVRNEKEWSIYPCTKVVTDIQSGTSYGGKEKEVLDRGELGVLKISSVTQGWFSPDKFKAVNKSIINKPLKFVARGDFLFSRANTIELVAACCIVDKDYQNLFIPDKLWLLSFSELVKQQYFNFLLKNENFRNKVRKKASGGHDSMLNISMKKFRSLDIPVPPFELQEKFSFFVEKVKVIKTHYHQNLTEMESLYGALSQKAFKGELDLSHIQLPEDGEIHIPAELKNVEEAVCDTSIESPLLGEFVEYPMSHPERRKQLLLTAFNHFLSGHESDTVISLGELWQKFSWETLDFTDESDPPLGPNDYNLIKRELFRMLEAGQLVQGLDEESNAIILKVAT